MNNQSASRILRIVGVVILVALAWRRAATSDEPWLPSVLGAVAVVGLVVAAVWWSGRRADGVRRQAVAARPGWRTQAVWADTTLGATLDQLGAAAGKVRGGTRLTLAWSTTEVQLWRGPTVLTSVPWDQVWTITRTVGQAASTGNPAVELVLRDTVRLVVVPARRPDGGMLPASAAQADILVEELRAARHAADAPAPPAQP